MSEQYFRHESNDSDTVEESNQDLNRPEDNSDLNPGSTPVDEGLIPDTSLREPIVVVPLVDEMAVQMAPQSETVAHEAPISAKVGSPAALLDREVSEHFRTRWNEIQSTFVDEPRIAVQQADGLVSEVAEKITQMFAAEHSLLESQWKQGNDVSTEDLRKALQHYRSFFNRLVL
jgi:hypothetical protein